MSYSKKPTCTMRAAIDLALQYGGGKLKRGPGGIWTYNGEPIDETREPTQGFVDTTILSLHRWGFVRISGREPKTHPTDIAGSMCEVEVVREALRQGVPPEMMEALWMLNRIVGFVEKQGLAGRIEAQDDARALLRRYGMEPP